MKPKEVNQLYQAILAACPGRARRTAEMHYYAALRAWLRRHDQPVTLLLPPLGGLPEVGGLTPPSAGRSRVAIGNEEEIQ